MPSRGAPGMRRSRPWRRVPSSRWAANQTQSMLHQSRTPHEWSRWPGAWTASVSPSIAIVPLTRQGIS